MSGTVISDSTRLVKTSLSDQAAEALRRQILRNDLPGGSTITEREICEILGISRTPVREAIRTLVGEGLFVTSDTGRITVAKPDLETIKNLVRILGALEGLASELAAKNASDAELAKIKQLSDAMIDLVEEKGEFTYFDTNIAFHRTIAAASQNPQLAQMHKIIDDQLYQARYKSSCDITRRQRAITEHKKVVEALLAHDGQGASRAMIAHLKTTVRNLEEIAED